MDINRDKLETLLVELLRLNQLDFCNSDISHLNISQLCDYILERKDKYTNLSDLLITEYIVWDSHSLKDIKKELLN